MNIQVTTPHNELMLALSTYGFRTVWYEYADQMDKVVCNLCGRAFAHNDRAPSKVGPYREPHLKAWVAILAHEKRHIELLDPEKVAAAEALATLREVGPQPGHAVTQATAWTDRGMWADIFQEVWGAKPSVALPAERPTEDQNERRNPSHRL